MRFQLYSDLHCDFFEDKGQALCESFPVLCDTVVIAGDLAEGSRLFKPYSILCERFKNVIAVNGNHDYYNLKRGELHNKLQKLAHRYPNFHWLNCSSVEIEGVRFHGATLWFPDHPMNDVYRGHLADFGHIINFVPWVYEEHRKAVAFFREAVQPGDVMITHHMPSYACVSDRFRGSPYNRFYVGDIESTIRVNQPSVVCSGHTHDPYDFTFHDSRLVANPHGYITESRPDFRLDLVIEIPGAQKTAEGGSPLGG